MISVPGCLLEYDLQKTYAAEELRRFFLFGADLGGINKETEKKNEEYSKINESISKLFQALSIYSMKGKRCTTVQSAKPPFIRALTIMIKLIKIKDICPHTGGYNNEAGYL